MVMMMSAVWLGCVSMRTGRWTTDREKSKEVNKKIEKRSLSPEAWTVA